MRNYRWNTVEFGPVETIPVLVACPQSKLDGVVLTKVNPPESRRVRVMGLEALELFVSNGPAFCNEYGPISDGDSSRLLGLLQLTEALKHKDALAWKAALQRLVDAPEPQIRSLQTAMLHHQPGSKLGQFLADGLTDVRLVLWWKEAKNYHEILPGLHCQNVRSALYTLVLIRIAGGKGLGTCLNCGKPLLRQRGTRKTCSDACRYALWEKRRKQNSIKR